jgi:serine/threonine-protein kinase
MSTRVSAATTRAATAGRGSVESGGHLLAPGQIVASPETSLRYQIERFLGQGGFGQVYLSRRLGRSIEVPEIVCIKVSRRIDSWVREAYFGRLLDDHPRAIRVYDVFPLMDTGLRLRSGQGRPVLYCLALEYAPHGDLSAFMYRDGRTWKESVVRREIAGILEVLGKLHRGQLLHRDLTPVNVFVCEGRRLKLGDFGIVRQQSDGRGITARTMNTMTARRKFAGWAAAIT